MDENDIRQYSEELLQIVEAFRQKIITGTSDPENFLTISDIERLWTELRGDTSLLYSDMLSDLLSNVDESELIRKKKRIQGKGNNLTNKQAVYPFRAHDERLTVLEPVCSPPQNTV